MEIDDEWWIEFRVGLEFGKTEAQAVHSGERGSLSMAAARGTIPDREELGTTDGARLLGRRLGLAEELAELRRGKKV